MTVKSIADVARLDPGELVSACKGRVKAIFTFHTGKIQKGARTGEDYSIQNVILQDLTTPAIEITCKFDGREELNTATRGKVLNLVSAKGTKGLSGLKIAEDTYKGKTSKVLKVTASAEVTPGIDLESDSNENGTEPEEENRTEAPQGAPGTGASPTAAQSAKPAQTRQSATRQAKLSVALTPEEKAALDAADVHEAKKLAGRIGNTWLVAYQVAWHNRARLALAMKGDITEDMFHSMVSTIAIQMFRENAHLRMPYRDFPLNLNGQQKQKEKSK